MGGWMKNAVATAAVATSLATTVAAAAAHDMFLKIEGIKGESVDAKHKGEVDVVAWSWGIASTMQQTGGGGGGAGKAVIHDISISKRVDSSSPLLFQAAATGQHIKDITLVVRRPGKEQFEFIKIKLTDVRVASVKTHAVAASESVLEEVTFAFEKVEYEYRPQRADGSADAPIRIGWDIKGNVKM